MEWHLTGAEAAAWLGAAAACLPSPPGSGFERNELWVSAEHFAREPRLHVRRLMRAAGAPKEEMVWEGGEAEGTRHVSAMCEALRSTKLGGA